jgi:hypothetical protein
MNATAQEWPTAAQLATYMQTMITEDREAGETVDADLQGYLEMADMHFPEEPDAGQTQDEYHAKAKAILDEAETMVKVWVAATSRELPAGVASKKAHREFDAWTARIEAESLHVGLMVTATRVITGERNRVLHQWEEPAVITEIRNFDALVKFQDGTVQSSGLGLRAFELPAV